MRTIETMYHLARADLLSRIRQDRFLLVLGATALAGVLCVPPIDAGYNSLVIGGSRGTYNSAWIGAVFGIQTSLLLSLLGFFLVKGTVTLDHETRVGRILASTPISRSTYVLGKWLSNLVVLGLILGVLSGIAPLMQLVRAEDRSLDLVALCLPVWAMGLPVMALVAALVVLWEVLPILRGSLGGIVYFSVWVALLMLGPGRLFLSMGDDLVARNDLFGVSRTLASVQQAMVEQGFDPGQGTSDLFVPTGGRPVARFRWPGVRWTASALAARLAWLGLAPVVALPGAVFFDRFDPARWRRRKGRSGKRPADTSLASESSTCNGPSLHSGAQLAPVERRACWSAWATLVWAELSLALKGRAWYWYLVAAGLVVASWFSPLEVVRRQMLPLAWLWPMLVWSEMGVRARRHNTEAMVSSVVHPVWRQLVPAWVSGVLIALISSGGAALRLLLPQGGLSLGATIIGSTFVPSLALALGVWSGSSRLFEVVYLIWWYGMASGIAACDFVGVTGAGHPLVYLGLTAALILGAVWGGQRRLR